MKKAILPILLVLAGSLLAPESFGAAHSLKAPGVNISTNATLTPSSANHSLGGEMKAVYPVQVLAGQARFPRSLLLLIPAVLLGILYIVVKKQKLDIPDYQVTM